jgi:hypothetical protein
MTSLSQEILLSPAGTARSMNSICRPKLCGELSVNFVKSDGSLNVRDSWCTSGSFPRGSNESYMKVSCGL